MFAVPGSPLDPRARGANRLIREGATLTESADDVLQVFRPMLGRGFREPDAGPDKAADGSVEIGEREAQQLRSILLELLGPSPIEVDELIRQCGAPAPAVLAALLDLELAGRARRHRGSRVSLA